MARSLAQAARDWYEKAVRDQVLNEYRAYLEDEEYPREFLQEFRLRWDNMRENEPGLPDEVFAARLFYVKHFTDQDIGSNAIFKFRVDRKVVYAVRTTTDGDDTWVELYDARGKFLAAARTHLDVVAWGARDWLRAQVAHTAEYPPELRDAFSRSLWGQPLEGFHCMATRRHRCNASPPGCCIEVAGHLEADDSPHRCSRCGFTWGGQPRPAPPPPPPEPEVVPWVVKVYLREASGGFVKVLKDTPVTIVTKQGRRTVPVAEVRQIAFALRGEPPSGSVQGRGRDVVRTATERLTGILEGNSLPTHDPGGSSTRVYFAWMKKLIPLTKEQIREHFTFGAPETMVSEGATFGGKKRYRLVGSAEGRVVGTDLYALDSSLAAAAVHAGRVRPGEKGVIEVEIVPSPARFKGSTRNGVTSESGGESPSGAFRFLEPEED